MPWTTGHAPPLGRALPQAEPARAPTTAPHETTLAKGSAYAAASTAISGTAALATSITAARVIAPEEFGLMGVVLLTVGVVQALSQTGFERALVQRPDATGFLHAAWTFQVLRGVLLTVLLLALSPPLGAFFEEAEVAPLLAVMSLTFLVQGLRSASTVLMNRALDFRALFARDVAKAVCTAAASLTLVLTLRSVWALVAASLAGAAIDLIVGYAFHPYRPRFELDRGKLVELSRFGKWITAMSVLALVVTKADDLFVSKYLGVAALGLYAMAFEIANLPATHVTYVMNRVSFPTYARLRDGGGVAPVREAFQDVMRATVLVSGVASVFIFFTIPGIVQHVIGPRWEPIVPLVRVLVVAGFVRSVAALGGALFQAAGRPDLDFAMNVPRLVVLLVFLLPACHFLGVEGAAWVALSAVIACLPGLVLGLRATLGVSASRLLRTNTLPAAAACGLFGSLWLVLGLAGTAPVATWLVRVLAGIVLWLAVMWCMGRWTTLDLFAEASHVVASLRRPGSGDRAPSPS